MVQIPMLCFKTFVLVDIGVKIKYFIAQAIALLLGDRLLKSDLNNNDNQAE